MFSVSTEELALEARSVTTGYKTFLIENISFTLAGGTIFGLLGRSGSGKSTIINSLVGLNKPTKGDFLLHSADGPLKLQRYIGYSPQANALYPYLTVEENILTFAQLCDVPKATAIDRMNLLLKRLDLEKSKDKRIEQLSGGMEKRVDLAVALIHDPAIIVLDEPFNGLDISLQRFIWELLQEIAARGKIIIITSHLLDDVQRNCTKFGLVENQRFFGDEEIRSAISKKQVTLQVFLQELFREDLANEARK